MVEERMHGSHDRLVTVTVRFGMSDCKERAWPSAEKAPSHAFTPPNFYLSPSPYAFPVAFPVQRPLCAHQCRTNRHYIDCNLAHCRLSRFHRPDEHDCANTCEDMMLPDQGLIMDVRPEVCRACAVTNHVNGIS
ncbi:hypothetical protein A0H81_13494 [Grifola frondosa]|uniref:Uncharacterized protein n=1 Tax=Grifola frondosa TaxID=5627 RepID=A0A1C7LRY3_GRIFR|nr:hypothetical protein A0H81_13494 [Grifola frondosa]